METETVTLDKNFVKFLKEFNDGLEFKLGKKLGLRATSIIILELMQNNKILVSLKTSRKTKQIQPADIEIDPLEVNLREMHL